MPYLLSLALVLACTAALAFAHLDLKRRVGVMRRQGAEAHERLRRSLADLADSLAEIRATDPRPPSPLALSDDALHEWVLEEASREELDALEALLDRASERLASSREILRSGAWIEVAD